MDSEVEVGKAFDPKRHNIVGKEPVADSTLDKRVLRVMNEGLIIGRKLHINANVILGNYQTNSY
jgi:molecular chaperone GrpE (heat shock protein)